MLMTHYIQRFKRIVGAAAIGAVAAACSGGGASVADELRSAEAAIAFGDMDAAQNVASSVIGKKNLSDLPASQLARLSMVYMHLADSTDRENNIAQAADLYRMAFDADPDSAAAFYSSVDPEQYPYVTMLKTLVGRIDHPYNPEADSIDEMNHGSLPLPTDSL